MAKVWGTMQWRLAMPDPARCQLLAREMKISPVMAQVLYNRGLTDVDAARAFLQAGREQMLDPFLLRDMAKAVSLIQARIAARRPIMIYGDYDADGVTGTALLWLALRAMGAEVDYYIPARLTEGYGLNEGALREIRARGHDFVLSVDTGITAHNEAEVARSLGMTLVISDHHEPGEELPSADAIINPKRGDCTYPFKGLSGVGVAFKLALALQAPNAWELLDIAALGTIADLVPLVGENRSLVREGLWALSATQRPGLRALMEVAGVREPVTASHIGFALGPRINALGRMGSAMKGVELLTTADRETAQLLARLLDEENRSRQEVEASILQEALQQAEAQAPDEREYVLVLAGEGWHHGVVGICASRVLERYHRPTILLAIEGDRVRGSARSIPPFHIHRALTQVSDLFAAFGGHAQAAGMTLHRRTDIAELRRRMNQIAAQWLHPEDLVRELHVDATIRLSDVTDELLEELQALEPHGIGNRSPVLALEDGVVLNARTIGREQQHLKMLVTEEGVSRPVEAVGWQMAPALPPQLSRVRIAFYPEYDTYQGRKSLRLTMRDLQAVESPNPWTSAHEYAQWDPLHAMEVAPAHTGADLIDARAGRLTPPLVEVAEGPEREATARMRYVAALAAQRRILVMTSHPWAAAALAAELHRVCAISNARVWRPGEEEPQDGVLVVAPYGLQPAGQYDAAVLYHPPYHAGQILSMPCHLLWEEREWADGLTALGWVYPDREALSLCYKLLKRGGATPQRLAIELRDPYGPWSRLRWESALRIFGEVGLVDAQGRLVAQEGQRVDLEASPHYRHGRKGRDILAQMQRNDWPVPVEAI